MSGLEWSGVKWNGIATEQEGKIKKAKNVSFDKTKLIRYLLLLLLKKPFTNCVIFRNHFSKWRIFKIVKNFPKSVQCF